MSELSALAGSERYGVCEDEVALSPISVNTEIGPPEARAVPFTRRLYVNVLR
jgi:hypothetical protein